MSSTSDRAPTTIFPLGVEKQQKAVIHNAITLGIGGENFLAVEKDPDRLGFPILPIFVTDFGAAGLYQPMSWTPEP
jgi:hypothetical protein